MRTKKATLLSSTMIPLAVMAGLATGATVIMSSGAKASAMTQDQSDVLSAAQPKPQQAALPQAQPKPGSQQVAQCGGCNPCAAACNPCNPCAAACNPCNPCAAACNPCNPCAAACSPCNPCAAACSPCNPCAASTAGATECYVPRLRQASACNPCNPCAAAKACNPCNPCSAAACNPCNPCAAANPCNPCAAANPCNPCGACNPCAAGGGAELTDAEALAAYDCVLEALEAAYGESGLPVATSYQAWDLYSTAPYISYTHGERYVHNYANAAAEAYGRYEDAGVMPEGAMLAKDSFTVNAKGAVVIGPLFLMEKMAAGFNPASNDWRYTMVTPGGSVVGQTNGEGSAAVQFCVECHLATDADSMMFLPEEYRAE